MPCGLCVSGVGPTVAKVWLCAHQEHLPLTAWPVAGTVLLSDQSGTLEAPLDGEMLRLEGGGWLALSSVRRLY